MHLDRCALRKNRRNFLGKRPDKQVGNNWGRFFIAGALTLAWNKPSFSVRSKEEIEAKHKFLTYATEEKHSKIWYVSGNVW